MDDLEEFESWHEDLMAWERYQDELERIKGENTYDDLHDFEDKSLSLQRKTSFYGLWRVPEGREVSPIGYISPFKAIFIPLKV